MSTLTIRLPDDKHERLKALAKSNSILHVIDVLSRHAKYPEVSRLLSRRTTVLPQG